MVERRGRPCRLCVTRQAVVTELSLLMIGICCAVKVCSMAIPACVREALILIIDVALIARYRLMCTHEWERRVAVVKR